MNLLERIEQRVLFERLVIGLEEPVLVKGIGEISAKVDSGNGGFNVLHGTDLYQEGDMLHFKTVDGQGQVKQVATKVVDHIEVNIGGGHIQDRPVVELDIKFANTLYKKIPFSITDRGDNDNKILICKQFVEDELDALIDVGEKNISKKNVQVQAVNERSGFGGSSSGSTVGNLLHTGADAVKDGMKAVGSGAKTLGKKVGNIGGWLNGVADKAKQIRQGNWNGSFIFTPLGKALDVLGGVVSSSFVQALGVGAAAVALVGSFPWLIGAAVFGYGLWRFSNLKLGDGSLYKVPQSMRSNADQLKEKYKSLQAKISESVNLDEKVKDDAALLENCVDEDEKEKFAFDQTVKLFDLRGMRLPSDNSKDDKGKDKDIEGLKDRNNMFRAAQQAASRLAKKDVFNDLRASTEGSDGGSTNESCILFDQNDCRLILEACEAFLVEDVGSDDDDDEGEDKEEDNGKQKDDSKFTQEYVDKVFEKWLKDREEEYDKYEKFIETEFVSKRCFVFYYVPFADGEVNEIEKNVESKKYDGDITKAFQQFDAKAPDKSFEVVCKAMEQDAKGLYVVCLDGDDGGDRHAVVCLRSSEKSNDVFADIKSYVEDSEKLFGQIFGSRFDKSPFADIRGFVEDNGQNLFEEMFCSRFSKACRTVGFTEQDASAQFEQLFGSRFKFN